MKLNLDPNNASWVRWPVVLVDFIALLLRRFTLHQGTQNAAALTYTTLLSLVPLMTVMLAVFSAFPIADRVNELIQNFVFENFMPASGDVLHQHLAEFSGKASRLTGIGFAFLVVVALMMMNTIDRVLNAIWEVRRQRRFMNKFLIYWAVLSLGPVLMAVSVVVTSYIVSLPILSDAAASGPGRRLLGLAPVLASTLAFSLVYGVIPNRRVRPAHALAGGLVAALLFELAKRAFALYLTTFPTYEAIYGALATVPIFLVWVYLSWMVVLLGAEFTHCLALCRHTGGSGPVQNLGLVDTVHVLQLLDRAAADGRALRLHELVDAEVSWSEPAVDHLLHDLRELHILHQTDDEGWVLARTLDDLTLQQLYVARRSPLPCPSDGNWPAGTPLAAALDEANRGVAAALAMPLASFRLNRRRGSE